MADEDDYLLGRSQAELARLRKQVQELAGEAEWLLDQIQLKPGARALDLACGPQGILEQLSKRVGPEGKVVGLEKGADYAALARKFVADRGLANVEVVQGDAKATGLPRESFDLVHARLLLVNLPEPEKFVPEMVALARPGGVVASYEADFVSHACDPPLPAWDRLLEIFKAYSRARGIDLHIGRRMPRLLRDAGLVDIQVKPKVYIFPPGHNRRTILLDFMQNVRDGIVRDGFIRDDELTALIEETRRHLDKPETLVVSHLFFQVWGRKPNV